MEKRLVDNFEEKGFMIRLQLEYDQLYEKTQKLADFLGTEKFRELNETQQILLRKQRNLMINYLNILELRLLNLGGTPFSLSQIEYVEKFCGGLDNAD